MRTALLLALTSLAACAVDDPSTSRPGAGGGGKADDTSALSVHAVAVQRCVDEHEDGSEALGDCFRAANAASTDTIDSLIPEKPLEYWSVFLFTSFEERAETLCGMLGLTLVEDLRGDMVTACRTARSRDLAGLIDAYVAFDGASQLAVTRPQVDYVSCYETYDASVQRARSTADSVAANLALSDCIDAATRALIPDLVEYLDMPAADAQRVITQALDASFEGVINACTAVAAASGEGGGSLENVYSSQCQADGLMQIGMHVLAAIPME